MSQARKVLAEMRKRKRVDTRRGRKRNLAKKTYRDLMRSTASIRSSQNPVGKVEFGSVKAVPRNKQLIFKFETRAKTAGRAKYPQTIIFHKVQFSEEQTKEAPLRVTQNAGGYIYAEKLQGSKHPVSVRCTCFTGDTEVVLPNGESVTLRDLAKFKKFHVKAYDRTSNKFFDAAAGNAKVYDSNAEIVAVTLDNGHVVKSTPDHIFYLADGTLKPASALVEGDTLLSESAADVRTVESVVELEKREPVYCITVPIFGNFAIKTGENSSVIVANCEDYYFMWWWHDNREKAHAGPKMKPYTRITPLPPAPGAYPVRNPDEAPGLCKHLIACFDYLHKNKIMKK